MKLYYNPRSSYSQKVLLAFHEKQVPFTPMIVTPGDAELAKVTPLGKVPVLVLDDGWKIPESTIIVEYLETHFSSGSRLIPTDPDLARQTRFHDRLADLYVNNSMTTIFFDGQKPADKRNPEAVTAARARLDSMYAGFDNHLSKGRTWIMGDEFTLADCSLVPSLHYCRQLHPFDKHKHLLAYANRAAERPSFIKVQNEVAAYGAKM
jgi:glutathione S-transferase